MSHRPPPLRAHLPWHKTDASADVFAALAAAPDLPGALCAGRWELWDETSDPEIIEYTTGQCQSCPALDACREWSDTLKPSKRPQGVVAGRIIREPRPKKRAAS